ncbi:MAG: hypothetical protein BRD55_02195 [Bacteroidetes bacterium SW_9_63_38]|nr:MAG: hypothetical protein BRD55_02195 [Bacteroidetes bacterium SW_9_63_38]
MTSDPEQPSWQGHWRVTQYGEETPAVPTYYAATAESWDVVKDQEDGWYTARHPILDIDGNVIVLKDEGVPDDEAERWRVEVQGDTVRVTALTGEHEGAVGVAERIDGDPGARPPAA